MLEESNDFFDIHIDDIEYHIVQLILAILFHSHYLLKEDDYQYKFFQRFFHIHIDNNSVM